MTDLLLSGVTLPTGGAPADVLIGDGVIRRIADHGAADPPPTAEVVDLAGHLLLPSAVETHAHLDKALLAGRAANPTGDLAGAIAANRAVYPTIDRRDIRDRATAALSTAVARGFTLVRTHANLEVGIGTEAVEALLEVAREVADEVELEVVGLVGFPLTGEDGRDNRELLLRALELGLPVVGGAPALDPRPDEAVRWLVAAAADAGTPIDLHLDETLDPDVLTLRTYAREVAARGLAGRAVASHCVSLGQQDETVVAELARMLADAGIAVVTLPQTNLLLQGRDRRTRLPRATPPVRALCEAGVTVAGGGDNWRDMFNPLGRIDPFETAALLVAAAHLSPTEAYRSVSTDARRALGRPEVDLRPGAPAELLAVRADTLPDAVADASEERTVVHRGRVVSRTRVIRHGAAAGRARAGRAAETTRPSPVPDPTAGR
ncbi:MAG: amidohydrolase family protein [Micromonosporaceae bacterium]